MVVRISDRALVWPGVCHVNDEVHSKKGQQNGRPGVRGEYTDWMASRKFIEQRFLEKVSMRECFKSISEMPIMH